MEACAEPADLASFSALACRERWLLAQRIRESAGVDCLLLVLGPDAAFNRGSEVAFNWLLVGLGGRELLAAPLERRHEECVVCIAAARSVVFCRREVQAELVAKTAMWESCEVVAASEEEEADVDRYDARKVGAFIHTVSSFGSIGPALRCSEAGADAKMAIERWPLVQAYGYDEYGFGFLTLRKSVVNLEPLLVQQAYTTWDSCMLVWAHGQVEKLHKAWEEALLVQDRSSPVGQAPAGANAAAPLVDYFEYGRLCLTDDDIRELQGEAPRSSDTAVLNPAPRILAGSLQTPEILRGACLEGAASQQPSSAEVALHAVWEGVDPLSGVAATRTYMLHGVACGPEVGTQLAVLLRAYTAAEACCRHLLVTGAQCKDLELAEAAAAFVRGQFPDVQGQVYVLRVAMDALGIASGRAALTGTGSLVFLRVALAGLLCPATGSTLGTVAYGDSAVANAAASSALTTVVPRFACWLAPGERERSESIRAGTESALGIGVEQVRYIALGHRPGVRVPLEAPRPPPDPLALGSPIESGVRSMLAVDVGVPQSCCPVVGYAQGTAWTFDSGKMVLSSPRTGYVVLQLCRGEHGFPAADAADGQVWVPVTLMARGFGYRFAATVTPTTASRWRNMTDGAVDASEESLDLLWVGSGSDHHTPSEPDFQFISSVALSIALGGGHLSQTCAAVVKDNEARSAGVLRRCIWVSGLPGCGALDVAAPLAKVLNAPLVDLAALVDFDAGPLELGQLAAPLAQALQAQPASEFIVVCDVRCNPAEVLSSPLAQVCSIGHIVSVLAPGVAQPWRSGTRHPLQLSRTPRGWVNLVVVRDEGLTGRDWRERREQLLIELRACRGATAPVLEQPPTGAVLESLRALPSVAELALAVPAPLGAAARLQSVFVASTAPLDIGAFRSACLARLAAASHAAWPAAGEASELVWRGLFCVEARVEGVVAEELWAREAVELWNVLSSGGWSAMHELVFTTSGEVRAPQHWSWPLSTAAGVVWWWCLPPEAPALKLRREAEAVVANCRLRPPTLEPLWSLSDIPAEEVARLEAEVQGHTLPEGYFATNTHYVDVDGNKTKRHPELESRLTALVSEHNAHVEARNAVLHSIASLPLFGSQG